MCFNTLVFAVLILVFWSYLGLLIVGISRLQIKANGFNYVNPIWIFKNYRVNYIGTVLICILYNLICPIGSICYWISKICTVGRK